MEGGKETDRQMDGERKEGEIITKYKQSWSNLIGEIWSRFDEVGP